MDQDARRWKVVKTEGNRVELEPQFYDEQSFPEEGDELVVSTPKEEQ